MGYDHRHLARILCSDGDSTELAREEVQLSKAYPEKN